MLEHGKSLAHFLRAPLCLVFTQRAGCLAGVRVDERAAAVG